MDRKKERKRKKKKVCITSNSTLNTPSTEDNGYGP